MSLTSTDSPCQCIECVRERKRTRAFEWRPSAPERNPPTPKVTTKLNYTHEIRAFHNNPQDTYGEYISGGCYGKVYVHRDAPGLVVKEFDVFDGYPVWMAYAALAYRQGMGNAVLPRIYAVSLPEGADHTAQGYVLMERLGTRLCDVDISEMPGVEAARSSIESHAHTVLRGQADSKPAVIHTGYKSADRFYAFGVKHLHRVAAAASAAGVTLSVDMHRGNFMMRENDVVMTDPFTVPWVASDEKPRTYSRVHSLVTRICKEAAAFTPGFYSEYVTRREINIS